MARQNYISIVGQVCSPPRVATDAKGVVKAYVSVNVINGVRDNFNNLDEIKFDMPTIATQNEVIVDVISDLKPLDIIEVKGKFTTLDIQKGARCPSCGQRKVHPGNFSYIHPDHIVVLAKDLEKNESFAELRKHAEVSNILMLIGRLCAPPKPDDESADIEKTKSMQYTIAVNRKGRIDEDNIESRTDYIHVKSFGKIARSDRRFLTPKSLVLIDGMMQTRSTIREEVCEYCGKPFKWEDSTMLAVPYSVEYLQDYNEAAEEESPD